MPQQKKSPFHFVFQKKITESSIKCITNCCVPSICYTYTKSDQKQRRDLNISSWKWNARFRSCVKMCEGCCMSLLFVLYSLVLKINTHLSFMRSITCCMRYAVCFTVYYQLYNKYNLSPKPVILW